MPRLTEGGYDAGNDSDTVREACNRPVHTHLYALSLQKHEETGLSLCHVASVCTQFDASQTRGHEPVGQVFLIPSIAVLGGRKHRNYTINAV